MHEKQMPSVVLDVRVEIKRENDKERDNSDNKPPRGGRHREATTSLHATAMEPRETLDDDDNTIDNNRSYGGGGGGEPYHDHQRQARRRQKWRTARTAVGAFSLVLSLALLGLAVKMSVAYDEVHLIHISVAFIGFTVSCHCP